MANNKDKITEENTVATNPAVTEEPSEGTEPNPAKPARNAKPKEASYDPWSDMVSIKIPRDRNIKEDKLVIVNGRRFVIMRGVDVDVPRPVFEALRDQEEAMFARDAFIDANEIKATEK